MYAACQEYLQPQPFELIPAGSTHLRLAYGPLVDERSAQCCQVCTYHPLCLPRLVHCSSHSWQMPEYQAMEAAAIQPWFLSSGRGTPTSHAPAVAMLGCQSLSSMPAQEALQKICSMGHQLKQQQLQQPQVQVSQ